MKKSFEKNIIILKTLVVVFVLFVSFFLGSIKAQAQYTFSLKPYTIAQVNKDFPLVVQTSPATQGVVMRFASSRPGDASFTPSSCTTTSNGTCTVNFKAAIATSSSVVFNIMITSPIGILTPLPKIDVVDSIFLFIDKTNPASGDSVRATATTSDKQAGVPITFSGIPGSVLPNPNCNTVSPNGSCFVTFTYPATKGVFNVLASGGTYSVSQKVTVGSPTVTTSTPPTTTAADPNSSYTLLAPLPGLGEQVGGKSVFDVSQEFALGNYLNIMFKIFIGICAVLAMLMIVMGGLQYMTSELPSMKEDGKSRITGAILGLLLALSSYAILNTINPDLLKLDIALPESILTVLENEMELPPTASFFEPNAPSAPSINACTEGVSRISTKGGNFVLCNRIATNVKNMVDLAETQNINLSGWGFRTMGQQIQLRIKNCGSSVESVYMTKPSGECRPATARPGNSRHESGLAVDLKCDGLSIQTRDNKCFLWLKENARRFGLSNLASEPWHWSFDGK